MIVQLGICTCVFMLQFTQSTFNHLNLTRKRRFTLFQERYPHGKRLLSTFHVSASATQLCTHGVHSTRNLQKGLLVSDCKFFNLRNSPLKRSH